METRQGIIEQKTECMSSKGQTYWKFQIDGKNYNYWDYNKGVDLMRGNSVELTGEQDGKFWNVKTIRIIPEITKKTQSQASVYPKDPVGLAIEVFNAIHILTEIPDEPTERMSLSCDLVKQAQRAFN